MQSRDISVVKGIRKAVGEGKYTGSGGWEQCIGSMLLNDSQGDRFTYSSVLVVCKYLVSRGGQE